MRLETTHIDILGLVWESAAVRSTTKMGIIRKKSNQYPVRQILRSERYYAFKALLIYIINLRGVSLLQNNHSNP